VLRKKGSLPVLLAIDQHALHERLNLEQLEAYFTAQKTREYLCFQNIPPFLSFIAKHRNPLKARSKNVTIKNLKH
jgi:hypothetical protein